MEADESKAWEIFIDEGTKYLRTAVNGAVKRKEVFMPEILYNITAMSVEIHQIDDMEGSIICLQKLTGRSQRNFNVV